MLDFGDYTELALLWTYGAAIDELLHRGVVETRSNPIGGYAEWLVCKHLGLERAEKGQRNVDAIGPDGTRYQIKGRRELKYRLVEFGVIRDLPEREFEFVIPVAFNENYSVSFALKIEHASIDLPLAHWDKRNNGWALGLRGDEGGLDGVDNISQCFPSSA